MNSRFTSSFPFATLVTLCAMASSASAQTAASLAIGLDGEHAALTITGDVDTIYQIQSSTVLDQNNDWQPITVLKLTTSPQLWPDVATPVTGDRFYRAVAVQVEPVMNMVWIQPGTFTMGSPTTEAERQADEGPQTMVTLTQGFFMGKYEVTQGEFAEVIGFNPSLFRNGTNAFAGGTGGVVTNELSHPVEQVTWFDAKVYCAQLTAKERAAGRLPSDWGYRLPTEAEWEYACRAGTTNAFHYGPALLSGMANFNGRSEYESSAGTTQNEEGLYLGRTSEVGSYEPNAWGLHDMHGNLWEWCEDWYSDGTLAGGSVSDPSGPVDGSTKVFRGGSWSFGGGACRSTFRNRRDPEVWFMSFGFRVVLSTVPPTADD